MNRALLLPLLLASSVALSVPAAAQTGAVDLRGSIGLTSFLDEGAENHLLVAGSARYYFWRRLAFEAEFQYLRQHDRHYDLVFLPSISWDFTTGRVVPYVIGGFGVQRFVQTGVPDFSFNEEFVSGGGGVKFYLDDHWFVAPEIRVGWEPHVRVSAGVGYSWGR